MRDGLHRGAPVPKEWKDLIRVNSREATWRLDGPRYAEVAVLSLVKQLAPFLSAVRNLLTKPQACLDPCSALDRFRQHESLNTAESLVVDHLKRCSTSGKPADSFFQQGVSDAMSELIENRVRAINTHLRAQSPGERVEIMNHIKDSLAQTPVKQILQQGARGEKPEPRYKKREFDVDEDLRVIQ